MSINRHARDITVRVRNTQCSGLAVGSGFLLAGNKLVTNRHVVEGATNLQVETWDGRSIQVDVIGEATTADLAVVQLRGNIPDGVAPAASDPSPGTNVTIVGYPEGGQLSFSHGKVLGYLQRDVLGEPHPVMRATAKVEPGNSGGPVLDDAGRLVGAVYAEAVPSGDALIIPVSIVRDVLASVALHPLVSGCGSTSTTSSPAPATELRYVP